MTGRERFTKALRLTDPPDRVPVAPPFQGYWALESFGVSTPESLAHPKKAVAAIVNAQAACPFDAIEIVWDWFAFVDLLGCTSRIAEVGSPSVIEPALHAFDEVADLALVDTSASSRVQSSLVAAEALLEELGDEVFCYASLPLPLTLAGHLRGVADLMTGLIEHADEVHRLIEFSTEVIVRHLELYADLGVHGFVLSDPTASGDLISPRHYAEYAAPSTRTVIEALQKVDMPSILHVCGKTAKILPLVADTGATAFGFDASVDTAVVKQTIGASVCLLGNVDPVELLLHGSPETVRENGGVILVSKGWAGGGSVLGSGCDLSLRTPIENVRAMIEVGLQPRGTDGARGSLRRDLLAASADTTALRGRRHPIASSATATQVRATPTICTRESRSHRTNGPSSAGSPMRTRLPIRMRSSKPAPVREDSCGL